MDGTKGGRLRAMGWLKHSIPTGLSRNLSVTKAANILEMLRGNIVRSGNEEAIHVCNNCMVNHDCEMKMKHCEMSWVSRLGSQVLTAVMLLSRSWNSI